MKLIQSVYGVEPISKNIKYGGTERVVYLLNKSWHEKGHDSLVAAPKDSNLSGYGTLLPTVEKSIGNLNNLEKELFSGNELSEKHFSKSLDYAFQTKADVLQDNPGGYIVTSNSYERFRKKSNTPVVSILHAHLIVDNKDKKIKELQEKNDPSYYIAISHSQKKDFEKTYGMKVDEVIYHGISVESFPFSSEKQDYLYWMGGIYQRKGADLAIKVAKETGIPLVLSGKKMEEDHFSKDIKPYITKNIEDSLEKKDFLNKIEENNYEFKKGEIIFTGPVNDIEKGVLAKKSKTFLLPNRPSHREPFGLVIVEAMATGTPVIGPNYGSIPEIVNEKTGSIVDYSWKDEKTIDETKYVERISEEVEKISKINPQDCRKNVEERFSRQKMAKKYIDFYEKILNK